MKKEISKLIKNLVRQKNKVSSFFEATGNSENGRIEVRKNHWPEGKSIQVPANFEATEGEVVKVDFAKSSGQLPFARRRPFSGSAQSLEAVDLPYIWPEPMANERKDCSGIINGTFTSYYTNARNTECGEIPVSTRTDMNSITGICVDGDDIFVSATGIMAHLTAPVKKYTQGASTWYRWTESETQDRSTSSTGSGFLKLGNIGQLFYSREDRVLTNIPGNFYTSTPTGGARRIYTFRMDGSNLQPGVISEVAGHANQSLSGASVFGNSMISLCSDRLTNSGSDIYNWQNNGKILGLTRVDDNWMNSWELETKSILGNRVAYRFPGKGYNFSPPYHNGFFHGLISSWTEDRNWNGAQDPDSLGYRQGTTPSSSPLVVFNSRLDEVKIRPTGSYLIVNIWNSSEAEVAYFTNVLLETEQDCQDLFNAGENIVTTRAGTWDIWNNGSTLYTCDPLGVYLDENGDPSETFDPTKVGYSVVGTYVRNRVFSGIEMGVFKYSGRLFPEAQKLMSAYPLALPCDHLGSGTAIAESASSIKECMMAFPRSPWVLASAQNSQEIGCDGQLVFESSGFAFGAAALPRLALVGGLNNIATYGSIDGELPANLNASFSRVIPEMPSSYSATDYVLGRTVPRAYVTYQTYLLKRNSSGSWSKTSISPEINNVKGLFIGETITDTVKAFVNVYQIIPIEEIDLVLILRDDWANSKECYPVIEARSFFDNSVVRWKYSDLIEKTLLASDVIYGSGSQGKSEAGELEWTLGTTRNSSRLRPAMKLIKETSRYVLLVSTECFKKQSSDTSVPLRVEFRSFEINAEGYTVIDNRRSSNTGNFNFDARSLGFVRTINIPRPRDMQSMAIAQDNIMYNFGPFMTILDTGDIEEVVIP